MVSVIIPTHNRSKLVVGAIQSVLNQTYKEYEIIIVDDASSDDTREVIEKEFRDLISRGVLRYFRNEQWKEKSFSRNRGINEARGDYIAFLDDDDLFIPVHLEVCLAAIGGAQAVGTDVIITDVNRQPIGKYSYPFANKLTPNELALFGLGMSNSSSMIRKSIIEKVGLFREDLVASVVEDIDFFMRVAMTSSILHLKKETVLRQKHPYHSTYIYDINKTMHNRFLGGLKDLLLENCRNYSYQLTPKITGYLHLYLAWNSISMFMRKYAIKCLIEAVSVYPRLAITEPFLLLILCRMVFMWNRKVYAFLKRIKELCLRRV